MPKKKKVARSVSLDLNLLFLDSSLMRSDRCYSSSTPAPSDGVTIPRSVPLLPLDFGPPTSLASVSNLFAALESIGKIQNSDGFECGREINPITLLQSLVTDLDVSMPKTPASTISSIVVSQGTLASGEIGKSSPTTPMHALVTNLNFLESMNPPTPISGIANCPSLGMSPILPLTLAAASGANGYMDSD